VKSAYITFSIFHDDVEYRVSGTYTPEDPGQTSGPPERCYPPEPDSFEIDEAHPVGDEFYDMPGWLCEILDNLALEKAREVYHNQKDF
jgi:hypothetical protein